MTTYNVVPEPLYSQNLIFEEIRQKVNTHQTITVEYNSRNLDGSVVYNV